MLSKDVARASMQVGRGEVVERGGLDFVLRCVLFINCSVNVRLAELLAARDTIMQKFKNRQVFLSSAVRIYGHF